MQEDKGLSESPRTSQLRRCRYSETGRVYLLTSVTHNRQPIFTDWKLGRLLVNEFRNAHCTGMVESLAWVIMPDHFHWLVELRDCQLPQLMRKVKSGSTLAVTRAKTEQFKLWQKGYHDRALRREDDLIQMARYIVANPVRAGLVKRYGDYPLWDALWL
jgi:REP element-mobilizing transposase RayT